MCEPPHTCLLLVAPYTDYLWISPWATCRCRYNVDDCRWSTHYRFRSRAYSCTFAAFPRSPHTTTVLVLLHCGMGWWMRTRLIKLCAPYSCRCAGFDGKIVRFLRNACVYTFFYCEHALTDPFSGKTCTFASIHP